MHSKIPCISLSVTSDLSLYHTGPALDHGPLPSIFYFALSGPDSLTLDPYNQPIQFLQGKMVRAFSMDLPAHEANLPAVDAMKTWAEDYSQGKDLLNDFFEKVSLAIDFAIENRFVDPQKIAVLGLSRGGFIAAHVAARDPRIQTLALFAPVTKLSKVREFSSLKENPLVLSLELNHLLDALADRRIRFYIGNRDTRVDTKECFDFAKALVEKAHEKHLRSSHVEFIMRPSIGQMGHGTPPETFKEAINWVLETFQISSS